MKWFISTILLASFFLLTSCAFNKTLATFKLDEKHEVKIITATEMDPLLPILIRLFVNGELIETNVSEYEGTGQYSVISNYRYEMISDNSKKYFAIVQIAPNNSRSPEAVFDLNENFGYPLCPQKKGWDCLSSYCAGHSGKCVNKSNQIMEQIEKDNPNIKLKRYKQYDEQDCGNLETAKNCGKSN